MAALREQIATLETENVGPKDWVLMGEAGSRARPQNSLLEEDLDFERVAKAVPVVTETTVLALEETIKARILEGRFDDVIRVRPMDDKPFLPSRFLELKDTKSTQSLAQIYEEEYNATQTGGATGDGKLKQEHDEIEKLWETICGKLDALCNAHFVPKQASCLAFIHSSVILINPVFSRTPPSQLSPTSQLPLWNPYFLLRSLYPPCLLPRRCLRHQQSFEREAS
jgi:U3 small nucleolar RNA-associated protein MPP10